MIFKGYMFLKDSSGTIISQALPKEWEVKCYPEAEEMLNDIKKQFKNITGFMYTLIEREDKKNVCDK